MKKASIQHVILFALIFLSVLLTSLTPSFASDPIRIGILTELTGYGADLGAAAKEGVNLAVEEINRNGGLLGRKVAAIFRDDESKPPKGIVAVRELIYAKKVEVVLGPTFTTVNFAILPVINEAKIINLTLATGTAIINLKNNPYTFRTNFYSKIEAETVIDYAIGQKGYRKVAIIHDSSGYGKAGLAELVPQLKNKGITPLTIQTYNIGDKNMTGQLLKIKQTGAEAILAWGLSPDMAAVAKNMNTLGLDLPVFGGSGLTSRFFKQLAGDTGKNFLGSMIKSFTFNKNNPMPKDASRYRDEMTKRHGLNRESSLSNSGAWYDTVYVYARAVEAAGSTDREKVKAALENLRYKGVTGDIAFSPTDHEALEAKDLTLVYCTARFPEGQFSRPDDLD